VSNDDNKFVKFSGAFSRLGELGEHLQWIFANHERPIGEINFGWNYNGALALNERKKLKNEYPARYDTNGYQPPSPISNYLGPFGDFVFSIGYLFVLYVLAGKSVTCGSEWAKNCRYDWALSFGLVLIAVAVAIQGIILLLGAITSLNQISSSFTTSAPIAIELGITTAF
jgi:hypothetical protein